MKKVLIIGGGPAGCAIAHQISMLKGYEILVVEKSAVLGGGCKTLTMGGHPYTFGPRHFITDKKDAELPIGFESSSFDVS